MARFRIPAVREGWQFVLKHEKKKTRVRGLAYARERGYCHTFHSSLFSGIYLVHPTLKYTYICRKEYLQSS